MKQILRMMDNFKSKETTWMNIDPHTKAVILLKKNINGTDVFNNKFILNTEQLEKSFIQKYMHMLLLSQNVAVVK